MAYQMDGVGYLVHISVQMVGQNSVQFNTLFVDSLEVGLMSLLGESGPWANYRYHLLAVEGWLSNS